MSGYNPYQPPGADGEVPTVATATSEPLFTDRQVAGATFLGSPLAGFILMGLNERRVGRPEAFGKMIAFGGVAVVVVMLISFITPPEMPGMALNIAYIIGMQQLAKHWQGAQITERLSLGTPKASNWVVFGVGLACFVGVVGLMVGLYFVSPELFEA